VPRREAAAGNDRARRSGGRSPTGVVELTGDAGGTAGAPAPVERFTSESARSASLLAGIILAVVVESVAVHLLLRARHPGVAWTLTTLAAYSIVWLVAEHRAIGRLPIELGDDALLLRLGRRYMARVPLSNVAAVREPTWRTLPERSPGYLKASGVGDPNVVITFREPVRFLIAAGVTRPAREIGLRVDHPADFVRSLERRLVTASAASGA
jgi:hypothetical protein